tara:strand:- start:454 stop:597 length:144 start_codon:yes stop_codon:yes gene_type:complete
MELHRTVPVVNKEYATVFGNQMSRFNSAVLLAGARDGPPEKNVNGID